MRSVQVVSLDGPAGVRVVEAPAPTRGAGEVLVEVHALGMSWPDLLLSRGEYQLKPEVPFQLGVDFAGVVHEADGDSGLAAGDRVAGVPAVRRRGRPGLDLARRRSSRCRTA